MAKIIKEGHVDPQKTLIGDIKRPLGAMLAALSDRGVIKKEVLSAKEQAESVLTQAKQEAQRLLKQAEQALTMAKQQVDSERQTGFDQGRQQGLAEVTELLVQSRYQSEKVLRDSESQIVDMIMQIAEKIIGREIEQGAVSDIVKQALKGAVGQKIIVKLNPEDLIKVREREAELKNMLDRQQTLQLRDDPAVSVGGCLVETEVGTIDAQLGTQLEAIKKALGLAE
jgi:type III secretion protein L